MQARVRADHGAVNPYAGQGGIPLVKTDNTDTTNNINDLYIGFGKIGGGSGISAGVCAKAHVEAVITLPDGRVFHGINACNRPQLVCPRIAAGHGRDDYRLCATECWQWGHAEAAALAAAGRARAALDGATVYVSHWRVCAACRGALNARGIPDSRIICTGVKAPAMEGAA